MDHSPLCVAIPAFNRQLELARALDSLVAQTERRFEVVVCDDGSSEDLSSVVQRFSERLAIQIVRIENSGGPARPRNIAMQSTQADWIAFLDSDDWWFPDKVASSLRHLADDVDVLFHPLRVHRWDSNPAAVPAHEALVGSRPRTPNVLQHMLKHGNPLATSGTVVRRSAMLAIGGFCESREVSSVEDFDAWMRLAAKGARFRFLPEVLGAYWVGQDNISTFNDRQYGRQAALFARQLQLLPQQYHRTAEANFEYLLGSYGLLLNRADAAQHLRRVKPHGDLAAWAKARAKLIRRLGS